MPLTAGEQLGPYEILSLIGAGGMGEVYRARDTRLGRTVAIKVSHDKFTARFEQEARAISALNHPNICTLYDVGPNYLVMEFVDGETLAARLRKGPLPSEFVLRFGVEIATALEAAHRAGIVHRDLKPGNIILAKTGVKVLDFGLAKIIQSHDGANSVADTITASHMVMGTPAYMAPEQRSGKECDARTDIYALGLLLHEMATGKRAVQGQHPALESLPEKLAHAIDRCLADDPDDRWQTAIDVKKELEWAARASPAAGTARPVRRWWWVVSVAAVAISLVAGFFLRRPSAEGPELRLEITTPPTNDPVSMAISPDGRALVFAASADGMSQLWMRRLDSTTARALPGTTGATFPFWSPDSRFVAFFADRQLKRIDIESGSVQALAKAVAGRGGAWSTDGTIVYQPTSSREAPLYRISWTGGQPAVIAQHGRFPQFLPGESSRFLYYAAAPETHAVCAGRLNNTMEQKIVDSEGAAVYAPPGYLLFVRQGTLFSQRFDVSRLVLAGEPKPVVQGMMVNGPMLSAPLSASLTGPIVYRSGSAGGIHQFVWFDRTGKEVGRIGKPVENLLSPSLSPDGRRVALHRGGTTGVWLLDLERGVLTPFADGGYHPIWSPDASRIAFSVNQNGVGDLFVQPMINAGTPRTLTPVFPAENFKGERSITDWSGDGRFLLCNYRVDGSQDIWAAPLDPGRKPFPVAYTSADEENGQFSADGKWVAYQSDESGRLEIYAQPFPGPGTRVQISNNGGAQVRWRHDGRELFYIGLDGRLMAVPVKLSADGQSLESGSPVPLFATHVGGPFQTNSRQPYMVSADGQQFLMNTITEESGSPIVILLNWRNQ
jgi:Tol biopolymer transport system component/predicted Ser/Thr protein kinase